MRECWGKLAKRVCAALLVCWFTAAEAALASPVVTGGASSHLKHSFSYDVHSGSVVPIPPAERTLQTVTAIPASVVGDAGQTLEGAIFDPDGSLLFCNVSDKKVMRLAPDGSLEVILTTRDFAPGGLARHQDGRLFVSGINQASGNGAVVALSPDGQTVETIIGTDTGYMPNDLVFDHNSGFYFTDFRGSATVPAGGVYHVSPDFKKITTVIPNMCQANGVALSPDGRTLWATEYARNLLHRVNLDESGKVPLTGSKILYHFTGPAPDSMRVDSDGNVYVALVGQGRVLIFNDAGLPIGQVLLPGRDDGLNLRSTSLALHPKNSEMRVVTGNTANAPSKDATVFAAPAFAPGMAVSAQKKDSN